MLPASIFNDVLGPVMRGPSSSHCAAALRIGRICRDLMDGRIEEVTIDFDPNGSLATTHKGQGSDMGLFGGFLGWEAHDPRLPEYEAAVAEAGLDIHINIFKYGATHPNTYRMVLSNDRLTHEVTALSTGGGMIEIIAIDQVKVSMIGDFHETLIYASNTGAVRSYLINILGEEMIIPSTASTFVEVKSVDPLPAYVLQELSAQETVSRIVQINPVLPILSRAQVEVPFRTCDEMLEYNKEHNKTLWELALNYESARGNLSEEEVFVRMGELLDIMQAAVDAGLRGTEYEDRILGSQSPGYARSFEAGKLVGGAVLNTIVMSVTAIMEVKSSMGVIVAAPTAGACAALPGALLGAGKAMNFTRDEMIKGLLAAGLIGVFIAEGASFAAEVGGCQAECGSGSCMAAGALVTMMHGTVKQACSAASQALQNSLGMICDPIANRVEAPCLGKNVMAASNALSCANMALSNYDALIPLDQVIASMAAVSKQMVHELRCTSLGGLAITEAAKAIEANLAAGEEPLSTASRRHKIC